MSAANTKNVFIPGSDADPDEIFRYPFTVEDSTVEFLKEHGRIMFIIRGPAGTGKDSLAAMLSAKERYPNAVICCADHYFRNTFSAEKRDSKSLRQSHEYCKKKVESSCQKGNHPIIVKNTHVKKFELQNYLDLAAEYNYTVIMASTVGKFQISPEILAKSNTKGLDIEYFMSRLRQWQEILPTLVGWFMSPGDSSFLLNELKISLDYLLGDGKFCRILNVFDNDKLLAHYKVKRALFCVAACSKNNNIFDLKSYYNSDCVKEHYGQCFTLTIKGFLVTPSDILAIVQLDKEMRDLHQNAAFITEPPDTDLLNVSMQSLQISPNFKSDNFSKLNKICPFNDKLSLPGKNTAILNKWKDNESINIKLCSCIHLAQSKEICAMPWNLKMKFHRMLASVADTDGIITADQFGELEDGYRYCRLPENAWILKHPHKMSFKSVFTGFYV